MKFKFTFKLIWDNQYVLLMKFNYKYNKMNSDKHNFNFLKDYGDYFNFISNNEGLSPSEFFKLSGIYDFSETNGGICFFKMNGELCLYQSRNISLFKDEDLSPTAEPVKHLFGDFMGVSAVSEKERSAKRRIIESIAGSRVFLNKKNGEFQELAKRAVSLYKGHSLTTHDFSILIVSYIVSRVPGFLDFNQLPIDEVIFSGLYGDLPINYLERSSKVVSHHTCQDFETEVDFFVKELMIKNCDSILSSPSTNIIKKHFQQWQIPFCQTSIANLETSKIRELGISIFAMYDTSANSLTWLILYLHKSQRLQELLKEKNGYCDYDHYEILISTVIEAIRLGGANPTALWRKTLRDISILHLGEKIEIPRDTYVWLDRYHANRDSNIFSNPNFFDIENILSLIKEKRSPMSLMSRSRYEINSFTAVNTEKNPRKCPGRLFSIMIQAFILDEVLSLGYNVIGYDLSLKKISSMPIPENSGIFKFIQ